MLNSHLLIAELAGKQISTKRCGRREFFENVIKDLVKGVIITLTLFTVLAWGAVMII
jgi:hypothetical protein